MSWPYPADVAFIAIGATLVPTFTVAYLHDARKLWWNPRRKWGPQAKALQRAKHSVEDLVATKDKIRIEERQKWASSFEALAGHGWYEEKKPEPRPDPVYLDELHRILAKVGPDDTVISNMAGKPVVVLPPRGGGSVGGPRITPRAQVPQSTPAVISVGGRPAYPVRMGKWVGHYVIHDAKGDALLDKDLFTILKTYSDGHYSTCPYECDCPQWARRSA